MNKKLAPLEFNLQFIGQSVEEVKSFVAYSVQNNAPTATKYPFHNIWKIFNLWYAELTWHKPR